MVKRGVLTLERDSKLNASFRMLVGILIAVIVYIAGAIQLSPPIEDGLPTESFYPWILIVIMLAACSTLLFREKMWKAKGQVAQWAQIKRVASVIGITALYIPLLFNAGYWIATPLLSFGIALVLEYEARSKLKALIYPVILAIIIPWIGYLFFRIAFGVRLPGGVWF